MHRARARVAHSEQGDLRDRLGGQQELPFTVAAQLLGGEQEVFRLLAIDKLRADVDRLLNSDALVWLASFSGEVNAAI